MATSVTDTEYLLVHDAKTGKDYKIPTRNNCMLSADVGKITRPVKECGHMVEQGMRLLDHGLENTACMESAITYMYVYGRQSSILWHWVPLIDQYQQRWSKRAYPLSWASDRRPLPRLCLRRCHASAIVWGPSIRGRETSSTRGYV